MRGIVIALASMGLFFSEQAHAQSDFWAGVTADAIGQAIANPGASAREARCMAGEFHPSERQLQRIRQSAQSTMTSYFERVRASDMADVSDLFSRTHQLWQRTSDARKDQDLRTINDPLARGGAAPLPEPDQFFRSGDGSSAGGVWTVRDATESDRVVGRYLAAFRRDRGQWRLERLEVGGADDVLALTPYCHGFGDVDLHLAEIAAKTREGEAPVSIGDGSGQAPETPMVTPAGDS